MRSPHISVIICTRNPRDEYLGRVLESLGGQSLHPSHWELVIVDNHSEPPVEERNHRIPLNGRLVVEPESGLTLSRLRGIRESSGDLVVFVDDDNVLAPDYLSGAMEIESEFPQIGVFGGRLLPEFEVIPEAWMKPFWRNLALVDFERDRWTNLNVFSVFPPGAGLCVRRSIAEQYLKDFQTDPLKRELGRKGSSLASGEDTELTLQAIDAGWGVGQFTRLSLTHIIPKDRMTIVYHKRLAEGIGRSAGQLKGARSSERPSVLRHRIRGWLAVICAKGPSREIIRASSKGWLKGLSEGWMIRETARK